MLQLNLETLKNIRNSNLFLEKFYIDINDFKVLIVKPHRSDHLEDLQPIILSPTMERSRERIGNYAKVLGTFMQNWRTYTVCCMSHGIMIVLYI